MQLEAVREKAWEHGLTVTASVSHGDPDLERTLLRDMLADPLVGLVYATILTRSVRPLPRLSAKCAPSSSTAPSPTTRSPPWCRREILGGYVAARHLSAPATAASPISTVSRGPTRHGTAFAATAGRSPSTTSSTTPPSSYPGNWEPSSGHAGTVALLDLPDPPTAIFAASDMMALGVYDALKERGLRIPADVSVVGYDDREIARFMRPPLTTVVLPHTAMGHQAVEALLDGQTLPGPRQPQGRTPARRPQVRRSAEPLTPGLSNRGHLRHPPTTSSRAIAAMTTATAPSSRRHDAGRQHRSQPAGAITEREEECERPEDCAGHEGGLRPRELGRDRSEQNHGVEVDMRVEPSDCQAG